METLTPNEIAKILRIHPFSVTRLARQKKLPAFKVGGIWRFRKDQFEAWIDRLTNGYRAAPSMERKTKKGRS